MKAKLPRDDRRKNIYPLSPNICIYINIYISFEVGQDDPQIIWGISCLTDGSGTWLCVGSL